VRKLLFLAGGLTLLLGLVSTRHLDQPALLQGALTLGGAWIICGLFSLSSYWHGVAGAAIVALLGAGRSLVGLLQNGLTQPAAPYQAIALVLATLVLVTSVRALLAERARRQLAALEEAERRH